MPHPGRLGKARRSIYPGQRARDGDPGRRYGRGLRQSSGDAEGARTLIENIREIHPDTPVVLTSPGSQLAWEETSGRHAVTTLMGQPTGERLHVAIQAALAADRAGA